MEWSRTFQLVEAHCEGEIGKVVTSGILDLPGKTMQAKMRHINEVDDALVHFCMYEPRGCAQMAVNLLVPPVSDDSDAGFIVLLSDGAHPMSGSNCICVVTVLLETGMVPITGTNVHVTLDTPAGSVTARTTCSGNKCEQVTLEMPPAFLYESGVNINIDASEAFEVDIAFGGEFYALVDGKNIDISLTPDKAHLLADLSYRIQQYLSRSLSVQHPTIVELNKLNNVMFYERISNTEYRTCTSGMSGRVDRSPCGTGSTALFAKLYADGELGIGDTLNSRSIIDSRFTILGRREVEYGIQCDLTGRAWIYGIEQLGIDRSDPFPDGFVISDTWGPLAGNLTGKNLLKTNG